MRQDDLEADQERAGQRGQLQRRFRSRHECRRHGTHNEQALEHSLEDVQVRDSARVILRPVPERKRGLTSDLRLQRAVVERLRRLDRVAVEQQNGKGNEGGNQESRGEGKRGTRSPDRSGIGQPERRDDERRELRPAGERDRDPARPRVASQKPKMRKTGTIASFVFDMETY